MAIGSSTEPRSTIKALYASLDPRLNIYKLDKLSPIDKQNLYPDLADIKTNAAATICFLDKSFLIENLSGTSYTISPFIEPLSSSVKKIKDSKGNPFEHELKNTEKFGNEPPFIYGTGFYIGNRKCFTAGHCVGIDDNQLKKIEDLRIIFNFHMTSKHNHQRLFNKTDVYKIKRVIHHQYNPKDKYAPDWALIKLDKDPINITPLQFRFDVQKDLRVYMLGYPSGIPLKYSGEANVKNESHVHKFECDLAAFAGNSGSPVIDRITHEAVGILVSGKPDYELETIKGISRVITHRVTEAEIKAEGYEFCQRITQDMLDPRSTIPKEGRRIRRELSNKNSKIHEREIQEKYYSEKQKAVNLRFKKFCNKSMVVSAIAFPLAPIMIPLALRGKRMANEELDLISQNKANFEGMKNIRGGKSNFLESGLIDQWKQPNDDKNRIRDLAKIARNVAAYKISEEVATKLYNDEVLYQRNFSPEKILDLIDYEVIKDMHCSIEFAEKVLERMHKNYQNYFQIRSKDERMQVVHEAIIKEEIESYRNDPEFNSYSLDQIKRICRYQYDKEKYITFDDACKELGYPIPQPPKSS